MRWLLAFLLVFGLPVSVYAASDLYIRVDDTNKIIDAASHEGNLSSTHEGVGKVIYLPEGGDLMWGDHYVNGKVIKDSTKRQEIQDELQNKNDAVANVKTKLKTLGMTDAEIKVLLGVYAD